MNNNIDDELNSNNILNELDSDTPKSLNIDDDLFDKKNIDKGDVPEPISIKPDKVTNNPNDKNTDIKHSSVEIKIDNLENISDTSDNINNESSNTSYINDVGDILNSIDDIDDTSSINDADNINDSPFISDIDDVLKNLDGTPDNNKKPKFVVNTHEDDENTNQYEPLEDDDENDLNDLTEEQIKEMMMSDMDALDKLMSFDENSDNIDYNNIDISENSDNNDINTLDDNIETVSNEDSNDISNDFNDTEDSINTDVDNENNSKDLKDIKEDNNEELSDDLNNNELSENLLDNDELGDDNLLAETKDDIEEPLDIDFLSDDDIDFDSLSEEELDFTLEKLKKENEKRSELVDKKSKFSFKDISRLSSLIYSIIVVILITVIFINMGIVTRYQNLLNFNIADSKKDLLALDATLWSSFEEAESIYSLANATFYNYLNGNATEDDVILSANNNIKAQSELKNIAMDMSFSPILDYVFRVSNFSYSASLESEYILNYIKTKDNDYLTKIENHIYNIGVARNNVVIERSNYLNKVNDMN